MASAKLDPRQEEILGIIVRTHVLTNRPVGSKRVAGSTRENLSPATVRNIMADLEMAGYLRQPHTSAGRLPTQVGYRYYVDTLMARGSLPRSERNLVESTLAGTRNDLQQLMEEGSRLLSRLSRQIGMVLPPHISRARFPRVEFRGLGGRRVLAIFVDHNGQPYDRILATRREYPQSELERMGHALEQGLAGMTIEQIRERGVRNLLVGPGIPLPLWRDALGLLESFLRRTAERSAVFVDGTEEMIDQPEFTDVETMRALFRTLQRPGTLADILNRSMGQGGIQVHIGTENQTPELSDFTLVTSTYGPGERPLGSLGILGPMRMKYDRAIAVVEYVSGCFSHLLTESRP
jgi:heat-inducible transcriptional repressor